RTSSSAAWRRAAPTAPDNAENGDASKIASLRELPSAGFAPGDGVVSVLGRAGVATAPAIRNHATDLTIAPTKGRRIAQMESGNGAILRRGRRAFRRKRRAKGAQAPTFLSV